MKNRYLFQPTINGWGSWGEIYCSIPAFSPLIREIYQKEKLEVGEINNLTPGTNAVFRCGKYVIKIYAPLESGMDSARDFQIERSLLQFVSQLGINAPKLIASGEYLDRYCFPYLVMDYVEGMEAGEVLANYSRKRKVEVVRQIKEMLETLHRPAGEIPELPEIDLKKQAVNNSRLKKLGRELANDLKKRAASIQISDPVLVHGDITGENVLISPEGNLVFLDFADAHIAPPCYELPPLLFELFQFDRELVEEWVETDEREAFFDILMDGLALHDFGPDIILSFLSKRNISPLEVRSLEDFRRILIGCLERR